MATGVVSASSDLVRKRWMREGLIQAASKSFWSPYTGSSKDSVVFQVNNQNASDGHTVVFDFDGNLAGKAVKGKDTAYGKGEQKRKFSDKITVDRYRLVADNGDAFDGVNIGDLSITEHSDSRQKLADLFVRFKDQALFDAAQGFKGASGISHSIRNATAGAVTYNDLVNIEKILRTGTGAAAAGAGYQNGTFLASDDGGTAGSQRAPLAPYRLANGSSIWLMMVDPYTAALMRTAGTATNSILNLATTADIRGTNNMMFRGLIGQIGRLVIVEAEAFFGTSTGTGLEDTEIEIAGMRQYDLTNTAWSGQSGFAGAEFSRNLILGQGALQMAFGKMPDYKFQASQDFGIKSESAVEFWMNTQKVNLTAENSDYSKAKRASLDAGVVAFDVDLA